MTDPQLRFPIILTVPSPQGQSAIAKLTQAGVRCELTTAPPILAALKETEATDDEGWSVFEKVEQPDLVGIKVLPDPVTGVRLTQSELEKIINE